MLAKKMARLFPGLVTLQKSNTITLRCLTKKSIITKIVDNLKASETFFLTLSQELKKMLKAVLFA